MTQIQGCGPQPDINLDIDLPSIDMEKVNPHVANHVESAEQSLQDRVGDLKQQIANSDDPSEKLAMKNEIMSLETAFADFKSEVAELSSNVKLPGFVAKMAGPAIDGMRNEAMASELRDVVADFRQTISESYSEFGTAEIPADNFCGTMAEREPVSIDLKSFFAGSLLGQVLSSVLGNMDAVLDRFGFSPAQAEATTTTAAASGLDASEETGAAGNAADAAEVEAAETGSTAAAAEDKKDLSGVSAGNVDNEDPREMMELFNQDPEAFYDELQDMPQEDRMMMMNMVQTQMQQMNQMFSMMSQFSQSMHDTHKAVINNLRV